jgi:hypothetical protein
MALRGVSVLTSRLALLGVVLLLGGCFAGYWNSSSSDYAVGEEHEVPYSADQTYVMVQDVLRSRGVFFEAKPGNSIITDWKPADTPASVWADLIGIQARYRYEMEIVPDGDRRSKIIANVRAEDIANNEIDSYKPSKRLDLFNQFDQLASKLPPAPTTPGSGGVNFALLPGENLMGLAKRVTGNSNNWQQIAKDNGLKSPDDTKGVQSVWVANQLLPSASPRPHPATGE